MHFESLCPRQENPRAATRRDGGWGLGGEQESPPICHWKLLWEQEGGGDHLYPSI